MARIVSGQNTMKLIGPIRTPIADCIDIVVLGNKLFLRLTS